MSVRKLLSYLPDEVLSAFIEQTQADRHVKRLPALLFLKLLLYGVLKSRRLSTRLLEHYYNSEQFALLSGKGAHQSRHSSISDRLKSLEPELLKKAFAYVSKQLPAGKRGLQVSSFDSTLVAASAALLKEGMVVGAKARSGPGKKQVKFSVGLWGSLPCQASLSAQQAYLSEDVALGELVLRAEKKKGTVLVFDRGISRRTTYEQLTEQKLLFVTRLQVGSVYQVVKERELEEAETQTLRLESDQLVRLKGRAGKWTEHAYRLLKTVSRESGEPIWFLTNMRRIAAGKVTELYRQRWQIEVFFKFLKQHLGLEHLLSYELKAIEVMLYVRLIAASLLIRYKEKNKLSSYKIAKEKFTDELEMELMKYTIEMCGGNTRILTQLIGYQKLW